MQILFFLAFSPTTIHWEPHISGGPFRVKRNLPESLHALDISVVARLNAQGKKSKESDWIPINWLGREGFHFR